MKKFVFILCAAVALFSLPIGAAALDTVTTVGGYGPFQTLQGGEFTLLPAGSLSGVASNYSGLASNSVQTGTFQTFCIEDNEYIYPNAVHHYVLNSAAVAGGLGGGSPDPISKGTAYLYYYFAKGTLAGYAYTNPGRSGGIGTSADLLQQALWYLENEDVGNGSFRPGDIAANPFMALVNSEYGSIAEARVDANGAFGVAVLNLYDAAGAPRQDVLVVTPEPLTMLLLGLGLVGLAGLRRKE